MHQVSRYNSETDAVLFLLPRVGLNLNLPFGEFRFLPQCSSSGQVRMQ